MKENKEFEQWFASYAEMHKLPKGSPFRVAIWHHCKATWDAAVNKCADICEDQTQEYEAYTGNPTNLAYQCANACEELKTVDISENND